MAGGPPSVGASQTVGSESAGKPSQNAEQIARSKVNWHDIEPLLKWAAVAYALGFLTVMWYTHRLGVPVLQLIEPVNVWIGAPLAVVVFCLDKLFTAAKEATDDFARRVEEASAIRNRITETNADLVEGFSVVMGIMVNSLALIAAPFGLLRPVQSALVFLYKRGKDPLASLRSAEGRVSEKQRKRLLAWIGRILRWAYLVSAVYRFVNSIGTICFVQVVCYFYVVAIFPRIPQTLGGGRPVTVQLILSAESLPKSREFRDWLPSTEDARPGKDAKTSILVPVTLYFRTEHELYVRKGSGPVVSLTDHSIEGIVFEQK